MKWSALEQRALRVTQRKEVEVYGPPLLPAGWSIVFKRGGRGGKYDTVVVLRTPKQDTKVTFLYLGALLAIHLERGGNRDRLMKALEELSTSRGDPAKYGRGSGVIIESNGLTLGTFIALCQCLFFTDDRNYRKSKKWKYKPTKGAQMFMGHLRKIANNPDRARALNSLARNI